MKAVTEQYGYLLPHGTLSGDPWTLSDTNFSSYRTVMRNAGGTLGEYVHGQILRGIASGLNTAFVIDDPTRARLIAVDPKSTEVIKPYLGGRNIQKWYVGSQTKWLLYMHHGIDSSRYPAIVEHLLPHKKQLEARATRQNWVELQQPQMRFVAAYEQHKIVFPDIARSPRFALDIFGAYLGNTAYAIPVYDLFLVGVLNSLPVKQFYRELSAQVRGGYLRFIYQYVEQIPIPNASPTDRNAIADLVQKCLDARGQGPEVAVWEAEIDERVARLYGLSGEVASAVHRAESTMEQTV